jgi:hypothetical protein
MSPTLPREEGVENASQTAVQEPRMLLTPETPEKRQSLAEMMEKTKIKPKLPPGSFTYLSPEYRKTQARNGLDSYTQQLDKIIQDYPETTEAGIAEMLKSDLLNHFEGKAKGLETAQKKTEKAEKDEESVRQEILSGKLAPSRFVGMEIRKPEVAAFIKEELDKIVPSIEGKTDAEIAEDKELMEQSKKNISLVLDLDAKEAVEVTDYSAVDKVAKQALANQNNEMKSVSSPAPADSKPVSQVGAALQGAISSTGFVPAPAAPKAEEQGKKPGVMRPAAPIKAATPTEEKRSDLESEDFRLHEETRKQNILRHGLSEKGFFSHTARIPEPKQEDLPNLPKMEIGQKIRLQDTTTFDVNTWEIKAIEKGMATIFNMDKKQDERTVPIGELKEIWKTNEFYKDKRREEEASFSERLQKVSFLFDDTRGKLAKASPEEKGLVEEAIQRLEDYRGKVAHGDDNQTLYNAVRSINFTNDSTRKASFEKIARRLAEGEKPLTGDQEKEVANKFHEKIETFLKEGKLFKFPGDKVMVNYAGRIMILSKVGGRYLPFYCSTQGSSGKQEGKWYPFLGIDPGDSWIIKPGLDDLEGGFGIKEVKELQTTFNTAFDGLPVYKVGDSLLDAYLMEKDDGVYNFLTKELFPEIELRPKDGTPVDGREYAKKAIEILSKESKFPIAPAEAEKTGAPDNLTAQGFLPEAAAIPQPAPDELPKLPPMEIGQRIKLQDAQTLEIATWEIKAIDRGMVTLFNVDKKENERTIPTGELKEIWRTNEYYEKEMEFRSSHPAPEMGAAVPTLEGRQAPQFEVLPTKQFYAGYNRKTEYNPKALASWKRNWVDSGRIDQYRAQYGNVTVSPEQVEDAKRTVELCLAVISHPRASSQFKFQAEQNMDIAIRILAGYNDNAKNNIQYYVENNIMNGPWLDTVQAQLEKLDETAAAALQNDPAPAEPAAPQEPVATTISPARLDRIQGMMNQVHAQAQADQFQQQEAERQAAPAQEVAAPLQEQAATPSAPEAEGWKEKALRRIKNIMNFREQRLSPSWKAYAGAIALTAATLVGTGEMLKRKEGAPSVPTASQAQPENLPTKLETPWTSRIIESEKSGGIKDIAMMIVGDIQLSPEDMMKKYAPSYFANAQDPARVKLALGMFGNIVQNDNMGNAYNLTDTERMELSNLRAALDLVSTSASSEPLKQNTTFEQEIMEIKQKVAQKTP